MTMHNGQAGMSSRAKGTISAGALAAAAGGVAVPSRRRAGSFLVLVVGTLALLAVITIVYVALGNQDARTRAAVTRREQSDAVPQQMAGYVGDILAADVLALAKTGEVGEAGTGEVVGQDANNQLYRREVSDIPAVQFEAFTPDTAAAAVPAGRIAFNAVGGVTASQIGTGDAPAPELDVQETDPWLAPHRPVFLNFAERAPGASGVAPSHEQFLEKLDWASVTNIAPDGAFVNLFNLRTNGFNATSVQMRANKSLLDDNGLVTTDLDTGVTASANRTIDWTMRQRRAFRPAEVSPGRAANRGEDPTNQDFKLYQWVDADGDGMLDSRIFEMSSLLPGGPGVPVPSFGGNVRYFFGARIVDLSGLVDVNLAGDSQTPATAGVPAGLTPADVDLRRLLTLEDLYANTDALDATAPTAQPSGQASVGLGFDSIVQPTPANVLDVGLYAPGAGLGGYTESQAYRTGATAYAALRMSLAAGVAMPGIEYDAGTQSGFALRGQMGPVSTNSELYDFANTRGLVPATAGDDPWRTVLPPRLNEANLTRAPWMPWKFGAFPPSMPAPTGVAERRVAAAARAVFFDQQAQRVQRALGGDGGSQFAGRFGVGDLAELLTRRATNDPTVLSTLEQVLGGRDVSDNGGGLELAHARYDVLRANRADGVERARYDTAAPNTDAQRRAALLQLDGDVRSLLTTLSGARQLRSAAAPVVDGQVAESVNPAALDAGELAIDLRRALDEHASTPNQASAALAQIYRGYADALAPHSYVRAAWDPSESSAQFVRHRTLFYGYRGPDVAMLAAGHMAANLADLGDRRVEAVASSAGGLQQAVVVDDTRPTLATLVFDRGTLGGLQSGNAALRAAFPSWNAGDTATTQSANLRLEPNRLAPAPTDAVTAAVQVVGVEPQPVLSQVSTFTVYVNERADTATGNIEIRTAVPQAAAFGDAPDVLLRVVAFKISNPNDQGITLSSRLLEQAAQPGRASFTLGDRAEAGLLNNRVDEMVDDFHYIRMGNRTYLLMQLDEKLDDLANPERFRYDTVGGLSGQRAVASLSPITIPPRTTIIAFAASEPPSRVLERLKALPDVQPSDLAPSGTTDKELMAALIARSVGAGVQAGGLEQVPLDRVYWIPMVSGASVGLGGSEEVANRGTGPATANFVTESGLQNIDKFVDVIPGFAGGADSLVTNRMATLWRTYRAPGLPESDPAAVSVVYPITDTNGVPITNTPEAPDTVTARNNFGNDIMLDRLRLPPEGASLNTGAGAPVAARMRRQFFGGGSISIAGTSDPVEFPVGRARAVVISLWSHVRRRGDAGAEVWAGGSAPDAALVPTGMWPGFGLETKYTERLASGSGPSSLWVDFTSDTTELAPLSDELALTEFTNPTEAVVTPALPGEFSGRFASKPTSGSPDGGGFTEWVELATNIDLITPAGVSHVTLRSGLSSFGGTDRDPFQFAQPVERSIDFTFSTGAGFSNATQVAPNAGTIGALTYDQVYPQLPTAPRGSENVLYTTPAPQFPAETTRPFRSPDLVDDPTGGPTVIEAISTLRLADALRVMAIGPFEAPLVAGGNSTVRANATEVMRTDYGPQMTLRYTTLGEALAMAMGYDSQNPDVGRTGAGWEGGPSGADLATRLSPWRLDGSTTLYLAPSLASATIDDDPAHALLFDRGHLWLDRFVPFLDENNGGANALVFNAGGANPDRRWGQAITPAMSALGQFVVPVAGARPQDADRRQTLTRATPGLINVNTAPVEVLRALPNLAPRAQAADFVTPRPRGGPWVGDVGPWGAGTGTGPSADNFNRISQGWDVAATIASYRDRRPEFVRPASAWLAAERMTNRLSQGASPLQLLMARFNDSAATGRLREDVARIPALADEAGMRSVGELLAARSRVGSGAASFSGPIVAANGRRTLRHTRFTSFPWNMDALGFDMDQGATPFTAVNSSPIELDPFRGEDGNAQPSTVTPAPPRDPANEYREQLGLLAGVSNLVTTRSDYFAAYLVVLGFREGDVQAVVENPAAQLTPSVQRRFLMVFDRSNVVRTGDQPRLLLMKEVPI